MSLNYLIFTESLDAASIRFIERTAETASKSGMSLACYTMGVKSHKALPASVRLHVYDKSEQVFDNTQNAYVIARRMTQAMADAVEAFAPDFFTIPNYPYRFNTLYQFGIQFTIARHKLNFFHNAMHTMAQYPDAQVIFLNLPYIFEPSWRALQSVFPILARDGCRFEQTAVVSGNTFNLKLKALGQEWKYRIKRLKSAFAEQTKETGGVLTFARARHHLAMMEPTLALLSHEHRVSVLDYFPKKFKAETPDFYAGYKGLDALQVLNPRDYVPSSDFMRDVNRHLEALAGRIIHENTMGNITDREKQFYWDQLKQLQLFLKQVLRLESIVRQLKPDAVCGCMEVDAFGFILMELQKQYPFKLINHLHGIAPHFEAMDFCRYDAFFIWNQMTKDVLLEDAYPDGETLRIVGNPFWEESGDLDSVSSETETVKAILAWKGAGKLIVAYSQPETNYSTPQQRTEFFEILFTFLENHPDVRILIKTHPNEFDDLAERLSKQRNLGDRVRFYKAKELPLYDSFRVADLTTSICSTVLLEGLYYHIPAVAIDFEGVNATLGNRLDKVVPLISERGQVDATLMEILSLGMAYPGFTEQARAQVYPAFSNSYSERVAQELARLGLLSSIPEVAGKFSQGAGQPDYENDVEMHSDAVLEGV